MLKQDRGLAGLMDVLKRKGVWEQTLFMFMGDVAVGDSPILPYDPVGNLEETRLSPPLLVKFLGADAKAGESAAPTTSVDIAHTILRALDLSVPQGIGGVDLFRSAKGRPQPVDRALVATLGPRFSARLGTWLLSGQFGKDPKLCRLDVDPACINNVYEQNPIAAQATWRWTYDAELAARSLRKRSGEREPASIDPDTGAALTVWGDVY